MGRMGTTRILVGVAAFGGVFVFGAAKIMAAKIQSMYFAWQFS